MDSIEIPDLPSVTQTNDGQSFNPAEENENAFTQVTQSKLPAEKSESLKELLFGKLFDVGVKEKEKGFQSAGGENKIVDPALYDVKGVLQKFFGPSISENDILLDTNSPESFNSQLDANYVQVLFGPYGPKILKEELFHEELSFSVLDSSLPPSAAKLDYSESKWLLEMSKMIPNRQTLHADPRPFSVKTSQVVESNDRMLYTPHNIIRWTYSKKQRAVMSNTRVVRWSDGSMTLHVGSDVHELVESRGDSALHLLGYETSIGQGDIRIPSVTAAVNPTKHLVVQSKNAHSIAKEVANENKMHHNLRMNQRMPYITEKVLPVDFNKKAEERNLYETYIAEQYEKRRKLIADAQKRGETTTLKQQLDMDEEMFNLLRTTDIKVLEEQQQEEKRLNALPRVQAPPRQSQRDAKKKRSRFDRDFSDEDNYGDDYSARVGDEDDAFTAQNRAEEEKYLKIICAELEKLQGTLESGSEAQGSVAGTLEFLQSEPRDHTLVVKEIAQLVNELKEADIDVSSLEALLSIY